jgi:hypothetical protein
MPSFDHDESAIANFWLGRVPRLRGRSVLIKLKILKQYALTCRLLTAMMHLFGECNDGLMMTT